MGNSKKNRKETVSTESSLARGSISNSPINDKEKLTPNQFQQRPNNRTADQESEEKSTQQRKGERS